MKIDHRILLAIHIPVHGLTRARAIEKLKEAERTFAHTFPKDYIVMFFMHAKEGEEKVILEAMNTEHIHGDLEKFEEIRTKFEEMRNFSDSMKTVSKYNL
jgi:hypothetical protein